MNDQKANEILDVLSKIVQNQGTINSRIMGIEETLKHIKKKVDAGVD